MIRKILVANRGEIAVRIIKTAKKLGISTVALYTKDEENALWAKNADESVLLSEVGLSATYLNTIRILDIAKNTNCDAIHPGYGFLSENWQFAQACAKENIAFIGPSFEHIKLMGNKKTAREFVHEIGIPVPKGITGSIDEIIAKQDQLSYPVIIKAVGGGGGKGMHIIHEPMELAQKLKQAAEEANKWFGNDQVFVEQYFNDARHIEVQVLGDNYGNAIHLFERECSLQRNYQKVIEEAPSPSLNTKQREAICDAAIKIVRESKYNCVGTIEFLWQNGEFFFLEMNTRIQVEHPVTEAITGIDIVEQQLYVANNFELKLRQKDVNFHGHAIEARIYAEDPLNSFKPSAGFMHSYIEPISTARIDSGYNEATDISPFYDGMISKVIVHSNNRKEAILAIQNALTDYTIHGIEQNIEFLSILVSSPEFGNNDFNTRYLSENSNKLCHNLKLKKLNFDESYVIAGCLIFKNDLESKTNPTWSINQTINMVGIDALIIDNKIINIKFEKAKNHLSFQYGTKKFKLNYKTLNNNKIEVVINDNTKVITITEGQDSYWIQCEGIIFKVGSQSNLNQAKVTKPNIENKTIKLSDIESPLHGTISDVFIKTGQKVKQGDVLLSIESMKTENQIICPGNGIVKEILISKNEQIKEKQQLITFK